MDPLILPPAIAWMSVAAGEVESTVSRGLGGGCGFRARRRPLCGVRGSRQAWVTHTWAQSLGYSLTGDLGQGPFSL